MYLILIKDKEGYKLSDSHTYKSIFTESLVDVAQVFENYDDAKVYSIDSLTEITDIQIQITEKTKEME